ncbi:MAG: DUF4255 domain-containing protein [Candidatus Aminicenantes bacterium]|nr:DUF4255 domain-containing protein [Candidatus Aminicenantes bacterium]
MSDYRVFEDLGETLKQLLTENLLSLGSPVNIVFDSPADIEMQNDSPHTLSLFLFKVETNPHMNNREMQNINHKKLKYPPITLDLFYLLTPFANDRSQEHLILGKVMQTFHDQAILKGRFLKEGLEGTGSEFRLTLFSLPFEEMFQLWQSFTEKSFRLSICYKVTPVEIDSTREEEARRVLEKQHEYGQKSVKQVT